MLSRRGFLRASAALAAAAAAGRALAAPEGDRRAVLERALPSRDLGKTGRKVGILGLGCFYLGNLVDSEKAVRVVRRAVELGVNYFDVAPTYNRGEAESRLGRGLKGARDKVFVATKTTERGGKEAARELDESLKRLGTDRVDLLQFHALKTAADVARTFGPGGAFEAIDAARKAGKVLHVGCTGHFDPALLAAVARERPVETVLMPLNCLDRHEKSFEEGALPAVVEKGLGAVAMKLFASGKLVADAALSPSPEECVRYVLSLPVSVAIAGCSTVEELEADLCCAKSFEPMPEKERAALVARTRPFVPQKIEWYKR